MKIIVFYAVIDICNCPGANSKSSLVSPNVYNGSAQISLNQGSFEF